MSTYQPHTAINLHRPMITRNPIAAPYKMGPRPFSPSHSLRFANKFLSFLFSPFNLSLGFLRSASMAESDAQINQTVQEEIEKLQYLEIVHLAAIRAVLCVSNLYLFAKKNSGPLKNGVESVEGTVKTVVGPVYDRYHSVPFDLLKLVDRKVGESVQELERHVPDGVKKAPEMARSVVGEVQRTGVVATAAGLAKAACFRAEPAAERLAASAWRSLNRLPVFPQVANAVVPAAAGLSDRYNRVVWEWTVVMMKASGFLIFV